MCGSGSKKLTECSACLPCGLLAEPQCQKQNIARLTVGKERYPSWNTYAHFNGTGTGDWLAGACHGLLLVTACCALPWVSCMSCACIVAVGLS